MLRRRRRKTWPLIPPLDLLYKIEVFYKRVKTANIAAIRTYVPAVKMRAGCCVILLMSHLDITYAASLSGN